MINFNYYLIIYMKNFTKGISKAFSILAVSIVIGLAASIVSAQSGGWQAPTVAPTGGNPPAPINVGSSPQSKQGPLAFGTTNPPTTGMMVDIVGKLGVNALAVFGDAHIVGQVRIDGGSPGAGKVLTSDANGVGSWQSPTAVEIPVNTTPTPSFFYDVSVATANNSANLKLISKIDPGTYTFSGKLNTANGGGGGNAVAFFSSADDLNTTSSYYYFNPFCGGEPATGGSGPSYRMYWNSDNTNLLFCLKRNGYNDGSFIIPETVITFTSTKYMYVYGGQVSMTGYIHY